MVKKIIAYKFLLNLVEEIIVKRIRSYIMLVKYKNEIIKCHCPTTCSIGNFSLQNLPCLLKKNKNTIFHLYFYKLMYNDHYIHFHNVG